MKPGMFVPTGSCQPSGKWRYYYLIIDLDEESVTVKLFGNAMAKPIKLPRHNLDNLVKKYGSYYRISKYTFHRADDPAIDHIIYAAGNPISAGREISELRNQVCNLQTALSELEKTIELPQKEKKSRNE
jgi:hypothetical protein